MATFSESDAGRQFVAAATSRGTPLNLSEAVAFCAKNAQDAETFLRSNAQTRANMLSVWEDVTDCGQHDARGCFWVADSDDTE